jgi:hypothetical protein
VPEWLSPIIGEVGDARPVMVVSIIDDAGGVTVVDHSPLPGRPQEALSWIRGNLP